MTSSDEIFTALMAALPSRFHADIPVLAQVLMAARDGNRASVATKNLAEALRTLQGQTLHIQSGNITVGNVQGEGIAIGHGAQANIVRIYVPPTAEQKRAWQNRSRMLEKVRTYWIEGFLQQSLHKVALIELGMQHYPDALEHPWDMFVQSPDRPHQQVASETSIAEVFDEFGSELLILGSPGAGKTTMLLELTRTLIERAQQDETQPIPVVFNLSSWALKRPTLADWLIEELHTRYNITRKVARAWIEHDQILPLLDGLDEMQSANSNTCIEAINAFHTAHGMVGLVVCSRVADYETITQKLRLQGAILLEALDDQRIEQMLSQMGKRAEILRRLLTSMDKSARQHNDPDAQRLVRTPLLLNIAALAYPEADAVSLPSGHASPTEQQHHLLSTYVNQMFIRRRQIQGYTQEQVIKYLAYLGSQLEKTQQTTFLIEEMQPEWLRYQWQRHLYLTLSLLGSLSIIVLTIFSASWLAFAMTSYMTPFKIGALIGGLSEAIYIITICSAIAIILRSKQRSRRNAGQPEGKRPLFHIRPIDDAMRWSWLHSFTGVRIGLIAGLLLTAGMPILVFPVVLLMSEPFVVEVPFTSYRESFFHPGDLSFFDWIIFFSMGVSIWGGIFGGILGVLFGLRSDEIRVKSSPNEGIRRSISTAIVFAAIWSAIIIIYSSILDQWYIGGQVAGVLIAAVIGGFVSGGFATIQHSVLRVLLFIDGMVPWNYQHLLNIASERIFLRRIGSGYIFVHRKLMEHFSAKDAQLNASNRQESRKRWQRARSLATTAFVICSICMSILYIPRFLSSASAINGSIIAEINTEQGLQLLELATILHPQNQVAYVWKGQVLAATEAYEQAIASYSQALTINPTDLVAYQDRGRSYLLLGQYEEAIDDFSKIIQTESIHDPIVYRAYRLRGIAYDALQQHDHSIADYSQVLAQEPRVAFTYSLRGNAHTGAAMYDEALADYAKAIELDPTDYRSYAWRGMLYLEREQYNAAIDDLTTAIDYHSGAAFVHAALGDAYYAQGKYTDAIAAYFQATDIEPQDAALWNHLCWYGSLANLARDVIEACDQAVDLAPPSILPVYRDSRGVNRALTGDFAGAIDDFEAYVAWAAGQEDYHLVAKRRTWIATLQANQNPFDETTLYKLQQE